jgi:hypothetical protein
MLTARTVARRITQWGGDHMLCPKCQSPARIASSKFESELGTTDVYNVQILVCVNSNCENNEPDLDSPKKTIDIVRNKVN